MLYFYKFTLRELLLFFLRYLKGYKGYKFLDLSFNWIFIYRDVKNFEHIFSYKNSNQTKITNFFVFSIVINSTIFDMTLHNYLLLLLLGLIFFFSQMILIYNKIINNQIVVRVLIWLPILPNILLIITFITSFILPLLIILYRFT